MRTICPECQTQAAVGVICPECMAAERKNRTPAQKRAERRWGRRSTAVAAPVQSGKPVVTYGIMAVTGFVGLLQLVPGLDITRMFLFAAAYLFPDLSGLPFQPWRLLTAALVHGGIWHLGLNMLALWMLGRSLEPMLGRWRFLALYLFGAVGGSVAVAIISPGTPTVGASGAVFGLFGALLVIGLHMGANMTGLFVLLGVNLVVGFIPGFNIAWQAHIGGAAVGALVGLIILRTRGRSRRTWQILLLVALAAVLLTAAFVVPPLLLLA
ncbi:membrane associated rhomboid family serine protease [Microbacterium ginsengiterrae]|uniref:Membrane associated rhomboid family serine protease n=2 Tax=Microbacteriaceae TaxID=85023 RepID=A0A7W9CBW1_9MICO|nr:membrane associated rhomboid family serine protease [Microbacterium ginsengiterrae]